MQNTRTLSRTSLEITALPSYPYNFDLGIVIIVIIEPQRTHIRLVSNIANLPVVYRLHACFSILKHSISFGRY